MWMLKDDNEGRTEKNLDCVERTCDSPVAETKQAVCGVPHTSLNNLEGLFTSETPRSQPESTQSEFPGNRPDHLNI